MACSETEAYITVSDVKRITGLSLEKLGRDRNALSLKKLKVIASQDN